MAPAPTQDSHERPGRHLMPSPPEQAALHSIYVRLLGALLARNGLDVATLLASAGLQREQLQSDTAMLPYAPIERLIDKAIEVTQRPWLGLEFGAAVQIHTHGVVGNAAIASGSLDTALRTLSRFAGLRTRLVRFEIERGSSTTRMQITPQFALGEAGRFVLDAMLVIVERMLLALAAQPFQVARYVLPYARPEWSERYGAYLSGDLRFDPASAACMEFDNQTLDHECLTADAQAFAQAASECARKLELADPEPELGARIRGILAASEQQLPTAESVARQLHLSPRSLYRRLKEDGLSYRDLVDSHRLQRARWLLANTALSVERIAERLGYADSSNFSRTFRRWTGTTPRDFRKDSE